MNVKRETAVKKDAMDENHSREGGTATRCKGGGWGRKARGSRKRGNGGGGGPCSDSREHIG